MPKKRAKQKPVVVAGMSAEEKQAVLAQRALLKAERREDRRYGRLRKDRIMGPEGVLTQKTLERRAREKREEEDRERRRLERIAALRRAEFDHEYYLAQRSGMSRAAALNVASVRANIVEEMDSVLH